MIAGNEEMLLAVLLVSAIASLQFFVSAEPVGIPRKYYGLPVGSISHEKSQTTAEVSAADERTLIFTNFTHLPVQPDCYSIILGPVKNADGTEDGGILLQYGQPAESRKVILRTKRSTYNNFMTNWPLSATVSRKGNSREGEHIVINSEGVRRAPTKREPIVVRLGDSRTEQLAFHSAYHPVLDDPTDSLGSSISSVASLAEDTLPIAESKTPSRRPLGAVEAERSYEDDDSAIEKAILSGKGIRFEEKPFQSSSQNGPGLLLREEREFNEWQGNVGDQQNEEQIKKAYQFNIAQGPRNQEEFGVLNSTDATPSTEDPTGLSNNATERVVSREAVVSTTTESASTETNDITETEQAVTMPTEYSIPRTEDGLAIFSLTKGAKITDFKWLGFYDQCRKSAVQLLDITDIETPKEEQVEAIQGVAANVSSSSILIKSCDTIVLQKFYFEKDNMRPNTYIHVGSGSYPKRIERHTRAQVGGKQFGRPLDSVNGLDLTIHLPNHLRTFDIDFLMVYNEDSKRSYGYALIPNVLVPPCDSLLV